MKASPLAEIRHEVTYRFVGGTPENGLLSCGFMRKLTAQKSQIDHCIPYYSCFVLLQGSGEYWDETGYHAPLGAGSVCQRLPGRVHSTRVEPDGEWLEFYVSFGRCAFDALCRLGLLDPTVPIGMFPHPESKLSLFQSLLAQLTAASDQELAPCLLEAERIALTLTRAAPYPSAAASTRRACELLEKDLRRELPLEEVARQLCVGYESLRKQFQREVGVSMDEYRQRKRLTTAQMMLLEGESVKAVSQSLGYVDSYAFSKQFKRYFHCAPSDYARSSRKP